MQLVSLSLDNNVISYERKIAEAYNVMSEMTQISHLVNLCGF
jgi:hypothetical protein